MKIKIEGLTITGLDHAEDLQVVALQDLGDGCEILHQNNSRLIRPGTPPGGLQHEDCACIKKLNLEILIRVKLTLTRRFLLIEREGEDGVQLRVQLRVPCQLLLVASEEVVVLQT